MVAFAFCKGYKEGYEVNHIDANKENNWCENLEWCTHKHNMEHVSEHSLNPRTCKCCLIDNGEIVKIFRSMKECCDEFEIPHGSVFKNCLGETNSTSGMKFRVYDEDKNNYVKTSYDKKNEKSRGKYNRKFICHQNSKTYKSQDEAKKDLNISQHALSEYLRNKRKSSVNGYTFEYIDI